jgi:hypothetical protein
VSGGEGGGAGGKGGGGELGAGGGLLGGGEGGGKGGSDGGGDEGGGGGVKTSTSASARMQTNGQLDCCTVTHVPTLFAQSTRYGAFSSLAALG